MADIAGAISAMKSRVTDNWTTTRIVFANETPEQPWPPVDANGNPAAFIVVEISPNSADIIGVGQNAAGASYNVDFGLGYCHILAPVGSGTDTAYAYAATLMALFRSAEFYQSAGFAVRTWRPHIQSVGSAEMEGLAEGLYWRCSVVFEFEFINIA